jgi:hypothetical protein
VVVRATGINEILRKNAVIVIPRRKIYPLSPVVRELGAYEKGSEGWTVIEKGNYIRHSSP